MPLAGGKSKSIRVTDPEGKLAEWPMGKTSKNGQNAARGMAKKRQAAGKA
jgi:hypothetical protein